MSSFTYFYDNLLNFYNAKNLKELSVATGIPISTISSIKQRESVTALKKKCRELNIFSEIFGNVEIINDLHNGRRFYTNDEIQHLHKDVDEEYIHYLKLQQEKLKNIPNSIINELQNLFNALNQNDKTKIKKITYQIEDFLIDLIKQNRQ